MPRRFPATQQALLEEVRRQEPAVAAQWARRALAEAVRVWEREAPGLTLRYRDSVVGIRHAIDPALPRRTLEANEDAGALRKEWREPITALQDDDWQVPPPARNALLAAYHAVRGDHVACVDFARAATREAYDDTRFEALWARWWACTAPRASHHTELPYRRPCEEVAELAVSLCAALAVDFAPGAPVVRDLAPPDGVEKLQLSTWTDGGVTVELRRTWEHAIPMESRDRSFEAIMAIPSHAATIVFTGADDLRALRIDATEDTLAAVRAAIRRTT